VSKPLWCVLWDGNHPKWRFAWDNVSSELRLGLSPPRYCPFFVFIWCARFGAYVGLL